MLAQGEAGVIAQEREIVVGQRARDLAELGHLPLAHQDFSRRNSREIVHQRDDGARFGHPKFAGAQFRVGKAEPPFVKINRPEIIRPVRFQQIELAHCSRRNDLGDLPIHDFPRLRFARLIADGNAPSGLDELCDVTLRRVIRHAAHRDAVPMGQRQVQQPGSFLGVVEKKLIEIPEPEEQQRIRRDAGAEPLVLLHHRGERVGHGVSTLESPRPFCEFVIQAGTVRVCPQADHERTLSSLHLSPGGDRRRAARETARARVRNRLFAGRRRDWALRIALRRERRRRDAFRRVRRDHDALRHRARIASCAFVANATANSWARRVAGRRHRRGYRVDCVGAGCLVEIRCWPSASSYRCHRRRSCSSP